MNDSVYRPRMKSKNPFDAKLELLHRDPKTPEGLIDAAIYVVDTLGLAWAAAQSVFENRATPELALEIYDRIDARQREDLSPSEEESEDDDE